MTTSQIRNLIIGVLVGGILSAVIFGSGLALGRILPEFPELIDARAILDDQEVLPSEGTAPAEIEPRATPASREELFEPFWEAWDLVHDEFVEQVDDVSLMRGAIRGMMEALGDPHSAYMDPDEYRQATISLDGTYEGIGAWVDPDGEYLTIISPMPNSPAEAAGLESGDEIIAVDGEDVSGMDGNRVIRLVMGPAGTAVDLTIQREGEPSPFTVEVTRREIDIPSVESRMLEGNIAYLRLFTFGDQSTEDLRTELRRLLDQDPQGLILDLRGNGGGFLNTAIEIASEFIDEGVILTERFGDGTEQEFRARRGGLATEIPLVVLIDEGSASASEIVAGAIQDHDRGQLLGTQSFGKGSVQNWIPLESDGGAVRITIARWYTPDGHLISEQGLEPDVVVEVDPEELGPDEDPQLERAVELLLE